MAVSITANPGTWLWVKNPVTFEITGATGELQYAKIQVYLDSVLQTECFYVANADYIKADISGYLKSLFDLIPNDRTGVTLYRDSETYLNVEVVILINTGETELYGETHTLLYGGKDVRDAFVIDDFVMVAGGTTSPDFLIEFDRLTMWDGQPFDIRFTTDIDDAFTVNVKCYDSDGILDTIALSIPAQTVRKVLKIDPTALATPIPDGTTWISISIKSVDAKLIIADYITPDCNNGVLLRWLNRVGGVHLWYFRKRDTKRPVKTNTVPLPESIDYSNNWNKGIAKVVDKEFQTNITLGAEHVAIADYDIIAGITKSERVDMYMGSGRWMQVIVADTDFNTAHDNDYQDIELTIVTI